MRHRETRWLAYSVCWSITHDYVQIDLNILYFLILIIVSFG